MQVIKKIAWALLILFIGIQFIRSAKNKSMVKANEDINSIIYVPDEVKRIIQRSCYDCHSNNTNYPWYSNIQPAGWFLARHIKNGKADLNFNEFATYSGRRQISKLKSIENSIKDNSMPLSSYLWLHKDARLLKEEKKLIMEWASKTRDSLEMK